MKLRQQYHFRQVGNNTHIWDVQKLLRSIEDECAETVQLERFADQINSDYWSQGKTLTCLEVSEHAKLIYEADLKYPILVCPEFKIMDGMHRLCRAYLGKKATIKCIVLKTLPEPDYINVDPEDLKY